MAAGKKRQRSYWLFNTDETESEGKGAYKRMIDQSCIAAWGTCIRHEGAERTLQQPQAGDTVFLYCAGLGIVASGDVKDEPPFPSTTVFPDGHDEFKRGIRNLKAPMKPLPFGAVLDGTGYHLPCRHIVCGIHDASAVRFILKYFATAKMQRR